jgi:predicted nucleic acid-binding protein
MKAFPDTSFLCSIYREQKMSPIADDWMNQRSGALPVSWLILWEFRHSVRFQAWLFSNDRTRGYPARESKQMIRDLQDDISSEILKIVPIDEQDVHLIAERLSDKYATTLGARAMDTLHLATALHLGASHFLTFDAKQKKIALSEGMTVPV